MIGFSNDGMQPTPEALTHSLPLISTFGSPIYVGRVPAAPFVSRHVGRCIKRVERREMITESEVTQESRT